MVVSYATGWHKHACPSFMLQTQPSSTIQCPMWKCAVRQPHQNCRRRKGSHSKLLSLPYTPRHPARAPGQITTAVHALTLGLARLLARPLEKLAAQATVPTLLPAAAHNPHHKTSRLVQGFRLITTAECSICGACAALFGQLHNQGTATASS